MPAGDMEATAPLLASDTTLDLHVYVDNTFVEVFALGGRVAMTATIGNGQTVAGMAAWTANTAVRLDSLSVYQMKDIWVPAAALLEQPGQ